jgi:hypothetical protein
MPSFMITIRSLFLFPFLVQLCNAQVVVGPTGVVGATHGISHQTVHVGCDPNQPLGVVSDAVTQRYTHIVADRPLDELFVALLGGAQDTSHPDTDSLFLKVNRVRLDVVGLRPYCLLHAEVIAKKGPDHVRVFERAVAVGGRTKEFTRKEGFGGALRYALQQYLTAFGKALEEGDLTAVHIATDALSQPMELGPELAPILHDPVLRKGLYPTFLHMRNNSPDTTYTIDERDFSRPWVSDKVFRYKDPSPAHATAWGLCDGETVYMRVGRDLIRLERTDKGFVGHLPRYQSMTYVPIVVGGGLLGALIGAAVGVGVSASMSGVIIGYVPYELDLTSGDFIPAYVNGANETYGSVIFYFDNYSKGTDTITVDLGQEKVVKLAKGQWTMFLPTPSATPVPVLVSSNGVTVPLAIDSNSDITKTYLLGIYSKGELKADRLNVNMEEKIFRKLQSENRVP